MLSPVTAAVIIAGGHGRRLGGLDKPALRIGDRSLLDIALGAVGDCPTVVVGPPRELPVGILATREDPPGGGPAAALAAGITALPWLVPHALIAVLAADLPGISRATVDRLATALDVADDAVPKDTGVLDGAVLVDAAGRRQYLTGVWRAEPLMAVIALRGDWRGAPLRELLGPLRVRELPGLGQETDDVDTSDDWQRWQSGH